MDYADLFRFCGYSDEDLDRERPRIDRAFERMGITEEDVRRGESRVKQVVQKAGGKLSGFARFQLGEGIQKETTDFAAEVAAAAKG